MALSYDEILKSHVGELGPYQIFLYFVLGFGAIGQGSFNVGIVFLAAVPEHWCASPSLDHLDLEYEVERNLTVPRNEDGSWSECYKYNREYINWTIDDVQDGLSSPRDNLSLVSCDQGWSYSTDIYESTIVTEWDLVCDYRWLQATAAAVYMTGLMVGVFASGMLSDAFGRRPVLLCSAVGMTISSTLTIFSTSYAMFIVFRFFLGAFAMALYTVAFVLCIEIIGPSWRSCTGIMWQVFFVIGYEFVTVAYFVRQWRHLQAVLVATCVPCLLYCLVPESPRWLYVNSRTKEAEVVLRRMACMNRKSSPEDFADVAIHQRNETGYVWDLLRTPRLRLRILVCCFIWFSCSVVYFGLSLNSSDLSGDPYLNFFLTGIVEIPAYILSVFAIDYIGRRWSLSIVTILAGAVLLLTMAVEKDQTLLTLLLVLTGKGGISCTFAIIYVVTAEQFPTAVRNQAVSTGSSCARIGAAIAPFIGQLGDFGTFIPVVVFGCIAMAAGLLSLLLPESRGVTLPETLVDGENFASDKPRDDEDTKDDAVDISLVCDKTSKDHTSV